MTKVSDHFSLAEFAQPARHGFQAEPYPEEWVERYLVPLCTALEVIRRACGDRPIEILSGFRSKAYNDKIGGAPFSRHVQGQAADFVVRGVKPADVHAHALALHKTGALKIGGLGLYPSFCHIDVRPGNRLARWSGSRVQS